VQGRVYLILRPGRHDDFAHPNAVILELGAGSFLCVAGFTPGKESYERAKAAEHHQGIWGPAFAVEVDHTKHLTPTDPRLELHVCGYVCQTAEVMTAAQLRAGRPSSNSSLGDTRLSASARGGRGRRVSPIELHQSDQLHSTNADRRGRAVTLPARPWRRSPRTG
jgi:hypothetical protein